MFLTICPFTCTMYHVCIHFHMRICPCVHLCTRLHFFFRFDARKGILHKRTVNPNFGEVFRFKVYELLVVFICFLFLVRKR